MSFKVGDEVLQKTGNSHGIGIVIFVSEDVVRVKWKEFFNITSDYYFTSTYPIKCHIKKFTKLDKVLR